jgi:outer membrane lipoprotein-sorting protein
MGSVTMRIISTFVLALLSLSASAQTINTPAQLIAAMHDRYASKWYHTLTFEQKSVTHKPDGTESTELWHEALMLPGRLRIDIGDRAAGNGMLFADNHLYIFKEGSVANRRDFIHPLMVLGFDVYTQPTETTMRQLKDLGIDLASMHEENFEGRPTYVVGAKQGDLQTLQFWIDKEHLYFVRMLRPSEKQAGAVQDVRFQDYKAVEGGGWLAEHVAIVADGKVVFEELYSDIKINPTLSEKLFDPEQFVQKDSAPAK